MQGMRIFALACAAALMLAGSAPARAGDALGGKGWLRAISSAERTIMIGKLVYHVTPRTRLRGMDGQPMGLGGLRGVPDLPSLERVLRQPRLWVAFDASRVGDRLELNWLEVESGDETMQPTPARGSAR